MCVQSLGQEDSLEEEMATNSSIFAWKIPWTGSLEVYNPWGHRESNTTGCVHIHMYNNGFSSLSKNKTCRYLMKIIGNIILLIKVFYKVKIT